MPLDPLDIYPICIVWVWDVDVQCMISEVVCYENVLESEIQKKRNQFESRERYKILYQSASQVRG